MKFAGNLKYLSLLELNFHAVSAQTEQLFKIPERVPPRTKFERYCQDLS